MKFRKTILVALFCTTLAGMPVLAETVINTMNFRAAPSAAGMIIGSVQRGSVVSVLGTQDGWDYISANGQTGWIHSGNLIAGTLPALPDSAKNQVITQTNGTVNIPVPAGSVAKVLYGMNFRAAPGMDAQIMNVVPAGSSVQYIGSSNGWDQIVFNGVTGWIAGGRITTPSPADATTASANANAGANTAANANSGANATANANTGANKAGTVKSTMNFRTTPGMNSRIMGVVPVGSKIQVISSSNGWDQIIYQGKTGWIKSGYTQ